MSTAFEKKLTRLKVDGLPLINSIMRRMCMRQILSEYIRDSKRGAIPTVDTLLLLVINLVIAKDPLYELQQWVDSLDLRCLGSELLTSRNQPDTNS